VKDAKTVPNLKKPTVRKEKSIKFYKIASQIFKIAAIVIYVALIFVLVCLMENIA